mgnify:CR=1 FL=1
MSFTIANSGEKAIADRIKGERPKSSAPLFDDYYLLLMLGLASGKKLPAKHAKVGEERPIFAAGVKRPPNLYEGVWDEIVALVVTKEIQNRGVDMDNKGDVNDVIQNLLSDDQTTPYTNDFWEAMNGYMRSGALHMRDIPIDKKDSWEVFMADYYIPLCKALDADAISETPSDERKELLEEWSSD